MLHSMDLTKGPISGHIKHIAVPASVGFFFNTMYNVVDTVFAGFISTQAIAALAMSFPVFFLMIACVTGLSTGASALLSNAIGAKKFQEVERLKGQVLSYAIAIYCILLPFCIYINPSLFQLLGAKGDFLKMAVAYMDIIFFGSIFFILIYSINSIFLAYGNSIPVRNYLIGGFFLNAGFVPWFIYGGLGIPALGFDGIATATVTVMFFGCIYMTWEAFRKGYFSEVKWKDLIPNFHYFGAITTQSLPASINLMTIGMGLFNVVFFVKFYGQEAVAAYGICIRIEQLSLLPSIGITMATLNIVGQNNGAGQIERVKETLNKSLLYALMVISVGSFMMLVIPKQLIELFTKDSKVVEIGIGYLFFASFTAWAYVILAINVSALQGMKKPYYPMLIGAFRQFLIPFPLYYFLVNYLHLGINNMWKGMVTVNWTAAIITLLYCRYVIKKKATENMA